MKNASLVLNAVLAVAVAVLYYLHFSDKNTTDPVAATTTKSAPVRKTVYVNVDSLLTNYDYFKDTRKVLESKRFQLDNELNNKGRSLQNEVAFFQQRAQTMTMEQGRATEAALQKKQQDLVAYRDRVVQQLAEEEQKKNEELYNQIHDYLKKVNKQNQYDFVMGYSRGGGILFADTTLDATKSIIGGLNKEYQQKQTKK
ncbi:OmpH family outer membrane protein [Larkinella humicola]|uniref:OmpH family outer membrane protein n=1 Tax=Larkinella humicola TaxID=2607654 RepID=A0A5N1JEP6_9BACT|nr:OmpH family outer membrane protein [Larkinella humicola]KAA9353846.1 OmpH family outer membrane protein [Larkinella humicola]